MNIAQLSEQLKDVPQNKLIDYAKNPNSVVPQFLALAEIQRRQRLQTAQPGQAPQSSVAEDIMAQEQPRMQGVAQLPTRAMFTPGMAGGGIVAFAEGGDAEDEYEELLEKNRRSRLQGMQEALAEAGAYFKNPLAKAEAKPTRQQRMAEQEMQANVPASQKRTGGHKYEDLVLAEAQRQGIDPSLARHVLYKETGNISNPENVRSKAGAIGIMQLMPKTAKELGVDPTDPEQNIRGGITYLRKMMDKYNDPVLAAAAYNAGPGRVDKALKGEGLTALPRETRMYIAGLAEGGEVKRYADEGLVDEEPISAFRQLFQPKDKKFAENYVKQLTRQKEIEKELASPELDLPFYKAVKPSERARIENRRAELMAELRGTQQAKTTPSLAAPTSTPMAQMEYQDRTEGASQAPVTPSVSEAAPPTAAPAGARAEGTTAQTAATSQTYFDALMKNIEEQAAAAKKSGDENKYLALMQAGFGMMASQSPYALSGIGQGAMAGVGTYAGLQKGAREDQRSLMAARLGLAKAKSAQEESEALRLATERYREQSLGQRGEESRIREAGLFRDDLRQYEQMRLKQIEAKYKSNPLFGTDPKLQDQYNREIAAIQNEPQYMALLKRAYPNIEMPAAAPAGGTGGWSIKPKQ